MNAAMCALLLLAVPASSFNMEVAMSSSLSFDAEGAKNRPVSKVITLLKDMQKQLEKEAAENQAALDKATAIREKQLAEFNEEEKGALEAISALKSAVTVLSKHNSLLQIPKSHMAGVAASVQNQMQKHASLLSG